jgi:hypothetical protein
VPHVGGIHLSRAPLEQAICKSARGGTHIQTKPISRIDLKSLQCAFELEPAAADVFLGLLNIQNHIRIELRSSLVSALSRDTHVSRHDRTLRSLPAFKHPSLHKQDIQTLFHGCRLSQTNSGFTHKISRIIFALAELLILPF